MNTDMSSDLVRVWVLDTGMSTDMSNIINYLAPPNYQAIKIAKGILDYQH